jgi:hypothetical protein
MEGTYKEEKEGARPQIQKNVLTTWEEISAFCA